jgi:DNA-binding XRE family transcriptional regulator
MTLHEWLRRQGRTDAWLAEQIGLHRATVTKIRNGRRRPSIEVAAKIQRLSRNAVTAADYCTGVWLREKRPAWHLREAQE